MSPLRIRYRLLAWTSRQGDRLGRRVTAPGTLVLAVAVVSGALGVDTNQTVAYQLFALAAALLLAAAGWAYRGDRRLAAVIGVERSLPRQGSVDHPIRYRLRIENLSATRQHGLELIESVALELPSAARFEQALASIPRRAWPDRLWPRRLWTRLLEQARAVRLEPVAVPALGPGATVELNTELRARRRGNVTFTGVWVARTEPLGLLRSVAPALGAGRTSRRPAVRATLTIVPRRYPVPRLDLPGARTYQPGGNAFAASVGDSEEFPSLREYRPGDPLQRIHWKSFARRGVPVVMEFQEEFFERHALVLDTCCGPAGELALEAAISVAASFASTLDTQESLLDLLFVGAEAHCLTAGRGHFQPQHLLAALAGAEPQPMERFAALARAVVARAGTVSSAILILAAADAPRLALVETLRGLGLPLRVLLVQSPAHSSAAVPGELDATVLRPGRIATGLSAL